MIEIFQDMNTSQPNPFVGGIFHGEGTDFETHLVIHDKIFQQLEKASMHVNFDKSDLCIRAVTFLSFFQAEKIPTNLEKN